MEELKKELENLSEINIQNGLDPDDLCIEECSELIKALSKMKRFAKDPTIRGTFFDLKDNILEETIDVILTSYAVLFSYGYKDPEQIQRMVLNKVKKVNEFYEKKKGGGV